jgi:hypothetical protein
MRELLFGSWGPYIADVGRQTFAYGVEYPWRVFAAALVVVLLITMIFGKGNSGTGGDGPDLGALDFGGGDGCGGD